MLVTARRPQAWYVRYVQIALGLTSLALGILIPLSLHRLGLRMVSRWFMHQGSGWRKLLRRLTSGRWRAELSVIAMLQQLAGCFSIVTFEIASRSPDRLTEP